MMRHVLHAGLATAVLAAVAAAQQPDDLLITKAGRELRGTIVDRGLDAVTFTDHELGRVRVPWTSVHALRPDGNVVTVFDPDWKPAGDEERPDGYIRWVAGEDADPDRLATGTSRWRHGPSGDTVLLVGVVHVGEQGYYEQLQRRLDRCDVVLFESVGKGDATDEELARLDALLRMQLLMRDALGLRFQKDGLDYDRAFWKRADVDFEDLQRSLKAHDTALPTDSPLMAGFVKRVAAIASEGKGQRSPVLRARAARLLGPALSQADRIMRQPSLAGLRGAIVEDRNTAALGKLEAELKDGPPGRTVALFYGAAHLPDLEARLDRNAAFTWQGVEWETAWHVPHDAQLPHVDRRAIATACDEAEAAFDDRLQLAIWLGGPEGPSWYERGADRMLASASSIKVAYLAELFASMEGRLDEPLSGLDQIVADPEHPGIVHFAPDVRAEIARTMRGASVRAHGADDDPRRRRVEQGLQRGRERHDRRARRTRGPDGATAREVRTGRGGAALHARATTRHRRQRGHPRASSVKCSSRSPAAGCTASSRTRSRRCAICCSSTRTRRSAGHYTKNGDLDSDPMTRIQTGFWETPGGKTLVYVVMGQLESAGDAPRDELGAQLEEAVSKLAGAVVDAAR